MGPTAPAERVRDAVAPAVESVGLILEDVQVRRAGARWTVEVVVDVPEDDEADLDLDRVALATHAVSDALDAIDVAPGEYTLEVGSRGVERPLTQRRHFARAIGRGVDVRTADGSAIAGRLVAVEDDDDAIVVVPVTPGLKGRKPRVGDPVRVRLADVASARVQVDLSGLGPEDDDKPGAAGAGQES